MGAEGTIVREQAASGQRSIFLGSQKGMLNYSHWPPWAQAMMGLLFLLVMGTLYWFAWVQPAIKSFAKFSPEARKTLAVSVVGMVVFILVWVWANARRN